jgi:HEAT repeat protein
MEIIEQETINHLVKTFRLAIANLKIYPATSQVVEVTLDTLYRIISTILEKSNSLTLSRLSDKLLVNNSEPEVKEVQLAAGAIVKIFETLNIQSMTFKKGLTKEELTTLLNDLLRKKKADFPPYTNIAFDQTVYVATIKGEEKVVKITETINSSGGDIVGLIKSIRESYDIIDQTSDPNTQEQLQNHLASELAKQDSATLRDIFDRPLPPKLEASGIKKRLLSSLSKDKIHDIFGEISTWYEEIRKIEGSDFSAVEQLEKLKGFIHSVLMAPAAKEFPRQFFEDLLRKGLISGIPEWFSAKSEKPTTIFEVERLLEKPPAELLEKETRDTLPQLIERLCKIDYNDFILKLVEKLTENLKNNMANIRLLTAQSLADICEILSSNGKEKVLKYIEAPMIGAITKETSNDIYFYLAGILKKRIFQNLLNNDYDSAIQIIELLRQHTDEEIMSNHEIRSTAASALSKLLPDIIEVLISDLKSDNDKKKLGSMQIFLKFGQQSIDALIKIIKETDDIRSRRLVAEVLKNMGEPAKKRFTDELNLGLTSQEIKRIIEVLNVIGDDKIVEHLAILLRYPDAEVKKEIMRFLSSIKTNQAKALLIEQLKDEDFIVVSEAARLLTEMKCVEAVQLLIEMLNSAKTPLKLQEEICIFLGMLGDYRAVPSLISKLRKKIHFWNTNSTELERVRMRCAWSLRKFSGSEVTAALESAAKDAQNSVALTAKESLQLLGNAK